MGTAESIRKRLDCLLEKAMKFLSVSDHPKSGDLAAGGPFKSVVELTLAYQDWYTEAVEAVRALAPGRAAEFEELYGGEPSARRRGAGAPGYSIRDYLAGRRLKDHVGGALVDHAGIFRMQALQQIAILGSLRTRLDSVLSDIRGVLQAEVLDNEIDAARTLLKAKHLRAAGAVAGVVLERHLAGLCDRHQLTTRKKKPTLSDFNDALKDAGLIDIPAWRGVQHLGDIRNICCHAKERDPKPEEVEELVDGVEKVTKTLF